jgi:hypothetical protein
MLSSPSDPDAMEILVRTGQMRFVRSNEIQCDLVAAAVRHSKFSSACIDFIGSEANAENFYQLRSREA